MIFLTLLLVLFISLSSASSASLSDLDDSDHINHANDSKDLKSNELSSNISAKSATLSAATKVKSNATKLTNASKATNNKKAANKTVNKKNTTTVNKKTLAKTSTSFMNSVERNGKFPKVKISNKNYSNTEYLYLMTKAVENESNSKIEIKHNLVKPYNNTKIKAVKGTIKKTEYVKVASKTRIFIEKNKRAPNWASCSKGNIPYNQLILLYGKCLDIYDKTNKLPNSVKLDDLDLDKIKGKIDAEKSKSALNVKKNATKSTKKTNTSKATSAIKKNTTAKKTTTIKKNTTAKSAKANANTTKSTKTNTANSTKDNASLVEKSIDYVHSILNNILDRLDPSKFKVNITKTDEGNAKINTSKVKVDVSGKSTVNVKISAKDTKKNTTKASTKKTTAKTKTSAKKTNKTKASTKKTTSTKKVSNKTAAKTSDISKSLKKYLESSKNCQVDSKQIKELAKTLTSSLKTDYDKGKKLFAWVRDNIQYEKYRNTRKGAVKTLKKKQGNCVDQTHLLVALSRAAGIPARYVNGGNCKFTNGYVGGHVWGQMYINKKWVVADTTSSRNSLGKIKNWNTKSYTLYGKYSSINF